MSGASVQSSVQSPSSGTGVRSFAASESAWIALRTDAAMLLSFLKPRSVPAMACNNASFASATASGVIVVRFCWRRVIQRRAQFGSRSVPSRAPMAHEPRAGTQS